MFLVPSLCRCWSTSRTWSSSGSGLMVMWSAVCPAVLSFITSSGHWTKQDVHAGQWHRQYAIYIDCCKLYSLIQTLVLKGQRTGSWQSCDLDYWSACRSFRSTEASPEPASILVGHAETLLPLLSLLGLYKDQTSPTADNYHSQHSMKPPSWRPIRDKVHVLNMFPVMSCRSKFPDQSDRPIRRQPALCPVRLPARPTAADAHQRVTSSIPRADGGRATVQRCPGHVPPPAGRLWLPPRVWGKTWRTRTEHRTLRKTVSTRTLCKVLMCLSGFSFLFYWSFNFNLLKQNVVNVAFRFVLMIRWQLYWFLVSCLSNWMWKSSFHNKSSVSGSIIDFCFLLSVFTKWKFECIRIIVKTFILKSLRQKEKSYTFYFEVYYIITQQPIRHRK